jgi:hypothetical protein
MGKLYSYVVEHDLGLSPNPFGGFCTLAFCKFSNSERRNVVELADVDDWVVGTGGLGPLSVGEHGRLVYAMLVTEKLTLREYFRDPRFAHRAGNELDLAGDTERFALISDYFFYFGTNALRFADRHLEYPIEKRGPGFRSRFPAEFIADFVAWLEQRYAVGVHGNPCAYHPDADSLAVPARPRRKCLSRRRLSIC